MTKSIAAISLLTVLCACSKTPNVKLTYYPAQASSQVTLTQTITCSADKKAVNTVNSFAVDTSYSADTSVGPFTFAIKPLDGAFADATIDFDFTADGRLSSVNQASTGKGDTILKSAASLAGSVIGLGFLSAAPESIDGDEKPADPCPFIKKHGTKDTITLTYQAALDFEKVAPSKTTFSDANVSNPNFYRALNKSLPTFAFEAVSWPECAGKDPFSRNIESGIDQESATAESDKASFVGLELQKMTLRRFKVTTIPPSNGDTQMASSLNFDVVVPTKVLKDKDSKKTDSFINTYKVPIPKAALFGGQTFKLTLSDAGTITKIHYGKTAGEGQAFNALGAIADQFQPKSASQQAAALKAQADLIYQQQRLAQCIASNSDCK